MLGKVRLLRQRLHQNSSIINHRSIVSPLVTCEAAGSKTGYVLKNAHPEGEFNELTSPTHNSLQQRQKTQR
jgi:hypothetical protein